MALVIVALVAACSGDEPTQVAGIEIDDGFGVAIHASGFEGPTQMAFTRDGDLIVAELNGTENAATGRIVRVSANDPTDRVVLQDQLDKPTGIAVAGDRLWVMERQRLSVSALEPGAPRTIIADDLPSNGRSEGTLTIGDDDTLYFDTSGSKRGAQRVAGSATIFTVADASSAEPGQAEPFATGFKHAYAHTFDRGGRLWTVEMTDGSFDDERAVDELLPVDRGDDAGWPQCVDDNRPVAEFGGSAEICASSPRSHALFGVGATPTSLVVSPFDSAEFIVALWRDGKVVVVAADGIAPVEPEPFVGGLQAPQHLLVDGDSLLLSEFGTGRILRITRR